MAVRKSSVVSKPITSPQAAEQIKAERKERNRLNRMRAKNMERRIAKYLGGDRTPQSGAGNSKGDVTVMFQNRPGRFLIECKLTELFDHHGPSITISKAWLNKIHGEAEAMNALFGILIYRYHARHDDFILIRAMDLRKIYKKEITTSADLEFNNMKVKTFAMPIARSLLCKTGSGIACVTIDHVLYYLTTLEIFKEIVEAA